MQTQHPAGDAQGRKEGRKGTAMLPSASLRGLVWHLPHPVARHLLADPASSSLPTYHSGRSRQDGCRYTAMSALDAPYMSFSKTGD
jgi:hypothetical protein